MPMPGEVCNQFYLSMLLVGVGFIPLVVGGWWLLTGEKVRWWDMVLAGMFLVGAAWLVVNWIKWLRLYGLYFGG